MSLSLDPRTCLNLLRPMPNGRGMVIVAGMPKSGTTAIAKLLAEATEVKVCSDPFYQLDKMNIDFRDALFAGDLSLKTVWRRYRHVFSGTIIKDPNFPLLLPQLIALFPDACLVSIIRDPRDNIRSILNRLGLPGDSQGVDLNLARITPTWRNVLIGQQPEIPGDNYVEVLAWRWRMSAEAFLERRNACFEIRYEDFTANKKTAIFNLAKRLGFDALADIDHLVDVQYQPKGNTAVRWGDFFGASQLAVIDRVTGPLLRKFGYAGHTANS